MAHRGIEFALLFLLAAVPVGVLGADVASHTATDFGYYGITPSRAGPGAAVTLGEQIYRSGVGDGIVEVPRSAERLSPGALAMVGCSRCHDTNGTGGPVPVAVGNAYAPRITFADCVAAGYTEKTLRRAIHDGLDAHGRALSGIMPRWQLTEAELDAVIAHLKALSMR